jgi:hypothetical protein
VRRVLPGHPDAAVHLHRFFSRAHLYLKRAKSDEIALGTPGRHRARLAGLVDLPGPPR